MSARDIIRQIQELPLSEQVEIKHYLENLESEKAPVTRRMDDAVADAAAERVFSEHAELFRKLAQ